MTNFMENPAPTDFMEKMGMMNCTVVLVQINFMEKKVMII